MLRFLWLQGFELVRSEVSARPFSSILIHSSSGILQSPLAWIFPLLPGLYGQEPNPAAIVGVGVAVAFECVFECVFDATFDADFTFVTFAGFFASGSVFFGVFSFGLVFFVDLVDSSRLVSITPSSS